MTIENELTAVLTGAGLTVYPDAVPSQGSYYPNVVYQIITNQQIRTHVGAHMERPRVQLSCHGKTKGQCITTANTVQAALDLNQTDFELATLENELSGKDPESGIYRIVFEYFIWVHT